MPTSRPRVVQIADDPEGDAASLADALTQWFSGIVISGAVWIVVAWLVVAVGSRMLAPSWNAVALDGDFEYLPDRQPSVAGGRLLDQALAGRRARSQMVIVESLPETKKGKVPIFDQTLGLDLLRRLYHRLGEVSLRRAVDHPDDAPERWLTLAEEALTQSIEIDQEFYELLGDRVPETKPTAMEPRMAIAYWDRADVRRRLGRDAGAVASDLESALVLDSNLRASVATIGERPLTAWLPLLDVYSWQDPVIGAQLTRPGARLAVLSLSSELAATGNIELLAEVQRMLDAVIGYRERIDGLAGKPSPPVPLAAAGPGEPESKSDPLPASGPGEPGRSLDSSPFAITGSAAIGGETLTAARAAIASTEWFTIAMVLLILAIIYRAPLLVAVPLVSIVVAVMVSTAVVTWLTEHSGGLAPWGLDLKVYTTSRIFVVVILFGAGTDYCLFLIARLREEYANHPWPTACRQSLASVSGALLGSALTTIFGLGMLWIADFGKFHHTGPIIAICLSIGLLVCMTLTPAVLRLLGPVVFWPSGATPRPARTDSIGLGNFWNAVAIAVTRKPWVTLLAGWVVLALPAIVGVRHEQSVTYDLSNQLSADSISRQGLAVVDEQFGVGQFNPLSVLLLAEKDESDETRKARRESLAKLLYTVPGVRVVRHLGDPLGHFPPDREMGLFSSDGWRRRALQNHRLAIQHYTSETALYRDRFVRLDVIVNENPFSVAAGERLAEINRRVRAETRTWAAGGDDWEVLYAGTTPSIVDLRTVTLTDTRHIRIAVVLAVFVVLLMVLRRIAVSVYLILTVLLSYYATLGLTYLFFSWVRGESYLGLDWKLPLFLFVILVAIGQDYNVYLVTRIIEERRRLGSLAAIRRAVAKTGGIITACGLVMAATFFSMTASAWWPLVERALHRSSDAGPAPATLQGIIELGFALGLGVLIDTLYVRTVLVPSFVVLHDRWRKRIRS